MQTVRKHRRTATLIIERAPSQEDGIRRRALQIYQARIGSGAWGDSMSDWLQAERELLAVEMNAEAHHAAHREF